MTPYHSPTRPPRRDHRAATTSPATVDGDAFRTVDGQTLWLRPVRPDDVEALQRGFARLTPEQIRLRVFHRMNELSPEMLHLLANVDPERGAAFVATDADGEIRGEGRLYVDRTLDSAEFALIVDPSLTGKGVGRALLRRLLAESRRRGLRELWGLVLTENTAMLDLAAYLGAEREAIPGELDTVRVRFALDDPRLAATD
ncbi:GNAT family N-acetyltransferase [Dokdonella sp.]|uniref:GNAT family N-acetyltransferase n=1 Tax=Dokdonella sp. TaxID=2291710 RepID=UPI001B206C5B|nr:GNAT family N-acetyltransferase [Dokdonella sp.]MBO9663018.1 GNAT family N-acetyltransferase [Dokdonella sp.]